MKGTAMYELSGRAENVDWSDVAMAGRAYADNIVGEPALTAAMHRMADEIDRQRAAADKALRDHFAAAALTGLLVHANDGIDEETLDTPSDIAYTAYAMADAMLRERSRAGQNSSGGTDSAAECTERDSASCRDGGDCPLPDNATNHDAAPAARARTDADRGRTDKADSRPGEGTGDTPVAESATTAEPVAWRRFC